MKGRSIVFPIALLGCSWLGSVTAALSQAQYSYATLGAAAPARSAVSPASTSPAAAAGPVTSTITNSNGIQYNGGSILDDAGGVNVYFIWYGDWSKDRDAKRILENFITHVGGTRYSDVNTTYYSVSSDANRAEKVKDRVISAVHYRGGTEDHYSQGSNLSGYQVYLAVSNSILSGALPADVNGVYFLLTSPDVYETGFGTHDCGWHSSSVVSALPPVDGIDLHYAFVGNADPLYAYECIWDYQTPLSGNLGADGMANIIAHELSESVTDPDGNAWTNPNGQENADLCGWIFGTALHSGSVVDPYPPNMRLNGVPYLIQELWVNAKGGYCALRWDE
jgi:hypothetical protein